MSLQAKDVHSLLRELRTIVLSNRIRVDEVFRDFDKLRTGYITVPQFASCLGVIKWARIALQQKHVDFLCDHYAEKDPKHGTMRVRYASFCDDLDDTAPLRHCEIDPSKTYVPDDLSRATRNELSIEEMAALQVEQARFLEETIARGMYSSLKQAFQGFDRHRCGRISETQFQRCFPFHTTDATMGLLLKRYRDPPTGDITYSAWVADIEAQIAVARPGLAPVRSNTVTNEALLFQHQSMATETTVTTSGERKVTSKIPGGLSHSSRFITRDAARLLRKDGHPVAHEKDSDLTPEDVEQAIVDVVVSKRIRIDEYFHDFDPLRSGLVSRGQFVSALSIAGVNLGIEETDALFDKYASSETTPQGAKVCWMRFADHIDSVFTQKHLEKDPDAPPEAHPTGS